MQAAIKKFFVTVFHSLKLDKIKYVGTFQSNMHAKLKGRTNISNKLFQIAAKLSHHAKSGILILMAVRPRATYRKNRLTFS